MKHKVILHWITMNMPYAVRIPYMKMPPVRENASSLLSKFVVNYIKRGSLGVTCEQNKKAGVGKSELKEGGQWGQASLSPICSYKRTNRGRNCGKFDWGKVRKLMQIWGKLRKVEHLPTWDCEADYGYWSSPLPDLLHDSQYDEYRWGAG